MAAKLKKNNSSVVARTNDGTIQITLTIPREVSLKIRELVIKQMIADITVPGFRKGKAPTDLAKKQIDTQKVYDHTLQTLLPGAYSKAVIDNKLQPILNPKFELLSVTEDRDWEVRAITCEAPDISLGDYKAKIMDLKKSAIWLPSDKKNKKAGKPSSEEKEQQIIKTILEVAEAKIPIILIEEEVNHKLSQLLDQVQRLGLSVEQYLRSTGRSVEKLKEEYAIQANDSIKLILVLNKIVQDEKIEVSDSEIESMLSASQNAVGKNKDFEKGSSQELEQKRLIRSVLLRKKSLEKLSSLI